jgi:penicillin-binding protein 1C
MNDLSFARGERERPPRRVMSVDSARLITSFLADPQARLPSFPRYGPLEYPFAVAVKTGTSQNYRDAWTLAYSQKFIVGVWVGRADAGAMRGVGGVASAARLTHAILARLHGVRIGEIAQERFAPPPGRVEIDLCRVDAGAECAQTLREWVRPGEIADAQMRAKATRDESVGSDAGSAALVIATPEHNMRIWRNPEQPERLNRLAMKLAPGAGAAQIVWTIDGEAFALARADETVFWPMTPGTHRIQARLALSPIVSRPVKVTVE